MDFSLRGGSESEYSQIQNYSNENKPIEEPPIAEQADAAQEESLQPKEKGLSERKKEAVNKIYNEIVSSGSHVSFEAIAAEVAPLKRGDVRAFKFGDHEYTISKVLTNDKQQTLAIAVSKLDVHNRLGEGGMGGVYDMPSTLVGVTAKGSVTEEDIAALAPQKVMKLLHAQDKRSIADVKNDAEISSYLNVSGGARGIPSPSHFFQYEDTTARLILTKLGTNGYELATRQRENGDPLPFELTPSQMQSFVDDAWAGVDHMHEKGVWHRDIKFDNMMVGKNPQGEPELKHIDFGGSKKFTEIFNVEGFPKKSDILAETSSTAAYRSLDVQKKLTDAYSKYMGLYTFGTDAERASVKVDMKNEMTALMKQDDRYSTALALYVIATGEEPYQSDEHIQAMDREEGRSMEVFNPAIARSIMEEKLQSTNLLTQPQIMKIVDAIVPPQK
ncbi:MAG: serine/threonine protein kinase [Verrucomicrobia bacterium]|nr:serine/threonine protein kinase [Verrucomicrobiota bacterium]